MRVPFFFFFFFSSTSLPDSAGGLQERKKETVSRLLPVLLVGTDRLVFSHVESI